MIFQIQKVIKKSQNGRNQCFSYYFCLMKEGSGSGSIYLTIREVQKHMDPADPDPQHCLQQQSLWIIFKTYENPKWFFFRFRQNLLRTKGCGHGLINYIDIKAKCRLLKRLTCKGTCAAGVYQTGDTVGHVGIFDAAL
jgi:hypothetical protein